MHHLRPRRGREDPGGLPTLYSGASRRSMGVDQKSPPLCKSVPRNAGDERRTERGFLSDGGAFGEGDEDRAGKTNDSVK